MSVLNKVGKAVSDVGKFMARYADEASDVADVLRAILPALPIGDGDKKKVIDTVNKLDSVADHITDFLVNNPEVGEPVKVKASDVEAAIAKYLDNNPDIIAAAVAEEMGKVTNDAQA